MKIRFGVFVPQGWRQDLEQLDDPVAQWEAMTAVARLADAGPWDSVWTFDHFHTVPETSRQTTFEAWTVTAALARDTRRVNLGQMVSCNGYRQPSLFAKIASTVDVASHGRLYAGLGAGWHEEEWRAYGYTWPDSVRERMGAFAEAVELVHRLWTEDDVVFTGRHYHVDRPVNEPKGATGKPRLWLGGGGERVTLRLVARYADGCNFGTGNPDAIRHKTAVLRKHCADVGRNPDEIARSTSFNMFPVAPGADPEAATAKARGHRTLDEFRARGVGGNPPGTLLYIESSRDLVGRIEAAVDAGATYIIVYIPGVAVDPEPLLRFADEVIPAFS